MKWIVVQSAWKAINEIDPEAAARLDTADTTFVGSQAGEWTNTTSCKSYAAVQAQDNLDVVLYDLEHWEASPIEERQYPFGFYQKAGQCLHARRQLHIAAPANDLILDMPGYTGANGTIYNQFLANQYPAITAQFADVFVAQAQALQPDLAGYTDYLAEAANQARMANPYAVVYAGLSTRNNAPAEQIINAYGGAKQLKTPDGESLIEGFWLNLAGGTSAAPLVAFLNTISWD